ncbi:unnamed protein product [Debaryomyces tyrocola]|nr:unnamed protein product [Debaryomyces tyrocola]
MVKEFISQEQIDNAPVLKPNLRLREGMIIMKDCHMMYSVPEIAEENISTVFESRYTPEQMLKYMKYYGMSMQIEDAVFAIYLSQEESIKEELKPFIEQMIRDDTCGLTDLEFLITEIDCPSVYRDFQFSRLLHTKFVKIFTWLQEWGIVKSGILKVPGPVHATPNPEHAEFTYRVTEILLKLKKYNIKLGNKQGMKISDYMRENFVFNHNKKNNIDEITSRMNILSLINEEKLVLSKKRFRSLQHYLNHSFDPKFTRRASYALLQIEEYMLVGSDISTLDALNKTSDPLLYGIYTLRRIRNNQRKVVGVGFPGNFINKEKLTLSENQKLLPQNYPLVLTQFELKLLQIIFRSPFERYKDLFSSAIVPGFSVENKNEKNYWTYVDKICLLLAEYVSIYGDGDFFNLICHFRKKEYPEKFKQNQIERNFKPVTKLDTGRGPTSVYNNLLNALTGLKYALATADEPEIDARFGRNRAFLAIDIMKSLSLFENDAFEGGRIPGWVNLMSERKLIDNFPFLNVYVGKESYL